VKRGVVVAIALIAVIWFGFEMAAAHQRSNEREQYYRLQCERANNGDPFAALGGGSPGERRDFCRNYGVDLK